MTRQGCRLGWLGGRIPLGQVRGAVHGTEAVLPTSEQLLLTTIQYELQFPTMTASAPVESVVPMKLATDTVVRGRQSGKTSRGLRYSALPSCTLPTLSYWFHIMSNLILLLNIAQVIALFFKRHR